MSHELVDESNYHEKGQPQSSAGKVWRPSKDSLATIYACSVENYISESEASLCYWHILQKHRIPQKGFFGMSYERLRSDTVYERAYFKPIPIGENGGIAIAADPVAKFRLIKEGVDLEASGDLDEVKQVNIVKCGERPFLTTNNHRTYVSVGIGQEVRYFFKDDLLIVTLKEALEEVSLTYRGGELAILIADFYPSALTADFHRDKRASITLRRDPGRSEGEDLLCVDDLTDSEKANTHFEESEEALTLEYEIDGKPKKITAPLKRDTVRLIDEMLPFKLQKDPVYTDPSYDSGWLLRDFQKLIGLKWKPDRDMPTIEDDSLL